VDLNGELGEVEIADGSIVTLEVGRVGFEELSKGVRHCLYDNQSVPCTFSFCFSSFSLLNLAILISRLLTGSVGATLNLSRS